MLQLINAFGSLMYVIMIMIVRMDLTSGTAVSLCKNGCPIKNENRLYETILNFKNKLISNLRKIRRADSPQKNDLQKQF